MFTHNIFKVTDQLSFTLGARYTIDEKKLSADLNGPALCANYHGNIARLNTLAAAAGAEPDRQWRPQSGHRRPSSVLATQVLTPPGAAPCGLLNSVSGDFSGGKHTRRNASGTAVLSYKPTTGC